MSYSAKDVFDIIRHTLHTGAYIADESLILIANIANNFVYKVYQILQNQNSASLFQVLGTFFDREMMASEVFNADFKVIPNKTSEFAPDFDEEESLSAAAEILIRTIVIKTIARRKSDVIANVDVIDTIKTDDTLYSIYEKIQAN